MLELNLQILKLLLQLLLVERVLIIFESCELLFFVVIYLLFYVFQRDYTIKLVLVCEFSTLVVNLPEMLDYLFGPESFLLKRLSLKVIYRLLAGRLGLLGLPVMRDMMLLLLSEQLLENLESYLKRVDIVNLDYFLLGY